MSFQGPYGDFGLNVPPSPVLSTKDAWTSDNNYPSTRLTVSMLNTRTTRAINNIHNNHGNSNSKYYGTSNNISWSASTGSAESDEDVSKLTVDDTSELASPWPRLPSINNSSTRQYQQQQHRHPDKGTTATMVPWPDANDPDPFYDDGVRIDEKKFKYDQDDDDRHYDTDYTDDPRSLINGIVNDENYNDDDDDNIDTILGGDSHTHTQATSDDNNTNEPSCHTDYYRAAFHQLHRRKFPLRDDTTKAQRPSPSSSSSTSTSHVEARSAAVPATPSHATAATNTAPCTTDVYDRIARVEANMRIVEDHVALYERLLYLEECMKRHDEEMQILQDALIEQYEHETTSVEWLIPNFEKKLLPGKRHFFESSTFVVCGRSQPCPFFLTVCVLEVDDYVPESRRPVAIFIKSALNRIKKESSLSPSSMLRHGFNYTYEHVFPLRLDGSSLTLVGNDSSPASTDKTIQVGEATMDDPSQGKGLRNFVTLGELRAHFLQNDDSVIVKATIRIPRLHTVQLETFQ